MPTRLLVLLALTTVLLLLVVPAVPALPADVLAAEGPAVTLPPEAEEEAEQPWTQRFLAPAVLLLGVVALGGSVLYYAVRIRGRYRVTQ